MFYADFLRIFHPLSDRDLQRIDDRLQAKRFKKAELLVAEGQIQRDLYFVKSGIQMSYLENDKKCMVVAFTYAPGLCAIPESFFHQSPSPYELRCLSDSELDCLRFEELQELFDQSADIERLFRKMTEQVLIGLIQRQIQLHQLNIEDRFRAFCQRSPHLLQKVPHKYLAAYLGMDATNFSKLYNSIRI